MTRKGICAMLVILLFLCAAYGAAADGLPKLGTPAPALVFKQLIQAPVGVSGTLDELKGKAVVLEFWATWCGGCVDSISHIDKLATEFRSKPIQFISVTDETDVNLVKHFLVRHPIDGWVALDSDARTFKRYGIEGRPQTVLINRTGIVEGITNPVSVTSEVLNNLLEGRPLKIPEQSIPTQLLGFEAAAPAPLLQILIRPAAPVSVSDYSPGAVVEKNGRYDEYGKTLRALLSEMSNTPENLVDAPEWCSKTMYDVSIITPQGETGLRKLLIRQSFEATFRLKFHIESKPTRVYVLTQLKGQEPKLRPPSTTQKSGYWNRNKGEAQITDARTGSIIRIAQFVLREEVIDETKLTGRYDFDLNYDPSHPEKFAERIREQLGLNLSSARRNLVHLVVDNVTEPKTW